MTGVILLVAVIVLLCVLLNKLSSRVGVPMLLGFIVLGMVFGTDGLLKIEFDNYAVAEKVCSIALVFIMFYGGFVTKWSEARPVAVKAGLLATLGVVLTAGLTGLFCFFVLGIELLESLLIGAVISSTDAASVFSILRSKKLGLKYNTASLLEMESGSNDPCSYMLTIIVLAAMGGKANPGQLAYMVFAQFIYGAALGALLAWGALWMLRRFHFGSAGFDMVFVIGVALFSYAVSTLAGGNGYLTVYLVGIVTGNGNIRGKQPLIHFFDGLTGLMQMLIFFLLGLLATPSSMLPILLPALLIALFLTFAARPLAVGAILSPARCGLRQQLLVSFAGLRGAASIVFAIIATVDDAYMQYDVFHIVFCIVLFSILLQGSLLPWAARRLEMIDADEDVLRTFNDYSDEATLHFIRLEITDDHPWQGRMVQELTLPPDTLLVMLLRGVLPVVPGGETVLLPGDIAVLGGIAFVDETAVCLREHVIPENSRWKDTTLADFSTKPGELIIMIKRNNHIIIPHGNTVLRERDVIVYHCMAGEFL